MICAEIILPVLYLQQMSILPDHMHATCPVKWSPPNWRKQSEEFHPKGNMQTVMSRQWLSPVPYPPNNSSHNMPQGQKNRHQTVRCQDFLTVPVVLPGLCLPYPLLAPVVLPGLQLPYLPSVPEDLPDL